MKKVIVIGCPGAGKSCFARRLRDCTGLPLYYLDRIWHLPDRTTVRTEEFDRRLRRILAEDCWILDGNYQRTLEMRLSVCDTVFLLDLPVSVCLSGAEGRIGKQREDLPWVEQEMDAEFRHWILDFPGRQLPKIYTLLEKYRAGREIVIFHTHAEADAYIAQQMR